MLVTSKDAGNGEWVIGNCPDSTTNESNYQLPSVINPVPELISPCQPHDFSEKPG
ncbi:hypothetical protein ACE1CM_11965 [Microseira sp. BLCC-F43]